MAVYKHGNSYWFEFARNGQRFRRSTGTADKRKAENVEREFRLEVERGNLGLEARRSAPTLREYGQSFMDRISIERAERPATVKFYAEKLARLLEHAPLRDARLTAIDEAMVDGYTNWRVGQGRKPATVNRQLATLRRLLRMAYRHKLVARVPHIRLLAGEKPREFVLSREQEAQYLAHAVQPLRDIAALCLDCGLRLGEALSLTVNCAQLSPMPGAPHGCLHVARSKRDSSRRYIPLTARAAELIAARLATHPEAYLFESAPGAPYLVTSVDHMHARTRTLAKLPDEFVLHGCRHSFGSRLADAGVDAWAIQKLMGHASIVTSQRYVHRAPEALGNAIQRLAEANNKQPNPPAALLPASEPEAAMEATA